MEQLIPILIFALKEAIAAEPVLADEISTILDKEDPQEQDWLDLIKRYSGRSYRERVPDTGLPPNEGNERA